MPPERQQSKGFWESDSRFFAISTQHTAVSNTGLRPVF